MSDTVTMIKFTGLALVAAAAFAVTSLHAGDKKACCAQGASNHGKSECAATYAKLNLSAEQKPQVSAIFDDARADLMRLRKESGPRFRELRERTDGRLQSVLTPEQWTEFQRLTNESRNGRQHRMGRERQR